MGGLILGLVGGIVCYIAVDLVKRAMKIDDSLDVMAVHGVGGITGTLLTGFLALGAFGGAGLAEGTSAGAQFGVQFIGVAVTVVWSAIATFIIVKLTSMLVGLRVTKEAEIEGLDLSDHGEAGYRF